MKLSKRILRHPLVQNFASWLAALYMRLVKITGKWEEISDKALHRQAIFAFWHGRLFMIAPFAPRSPRFHVLISQHRDGELIALVMKRFGIMPVRGSSTRGGTKAVREIMAAHESGDHLAITPDGPKGPARKVSPGVVTLSRKLNLPVIPVTYSASKRKILKTWDSFMLPLPFGRGVIMVGESLEPRDFPDAESMRLALETSLNRLTDEADARVSDL